MSPAHISIADQGGALHFVRLGCHRHVWCGFSITKFSCEGVKYFVMRQVGFAFWHAMPALISIQPKPSSRARLDFSLHWHF